MGLFKKKERTVRRKRPSKVMKFKQEHGIIYYFVIALILLFAANVALLPLGTISSLFYELEIWLISFLRQPITLQFWFLSLIFIFVWIFGYILTPSISIPSTGEWYVLRRRWQENEQVYFQTLRGKIIATDMTNYKKIGMHHFIINEVYPFWYEGRWVYQTAELEGMKNQISQEIIQTLSDRLAELLENEATGEPRLKIEHIQKLQGKGGEEQ